MIYISLFFRYSGTKAVVIAMICTFFEAFNIPVFWPILVMYFIILFVITMKRQIRVSIPALYCEKIKKLFLSITKFAVLCTVAEVGSVLDLGSKGF